jgi:hypothetical protein
MNNPPAFPIPPEFCDDLSVEQQRGMTLRDYFAAKAMPSVIIDWSSTGGIEDPEIVEVIARDCYSMADAMLKARKN